MNITTRIIPSVIGLSGLMLASLGVAGGASGASAAGHGDL